MRKFPREHPTLLLLSLLLFAHTGQTMAKETVSGKQVLLIVLDGLRPDYVTAKQMPNLHAWGEEGVVFDKHHATFPTVTRVNASSIATGAYPAQHGIVDNSVYFPGVEPKGALTTSSRGNLERIEANTGGNLLTVPSLGELLAEHGLRTGVFSSGSHGSAFLLNHKVSNGAIVNTGFILPQSLADRLGPVLGDEPKDETPNTARTNRVIGAYLDYGLQELRLDLTIMWITDPDHTAHKYGIDSVENLHALKDVDDTLGRIARTLEERGMLEQTNILVTSDHGFSTHTLEGKSTAVFRDFAKEHQLAASDIVVTGRTVYLREAAKPLLASLVERLQRAPWAGALFTRAKEAGAIEGIIPGTLALSVVQADHPKRAPDIVFSPVWTDEKIGNFQGTTLTGGVAGHGSASPWDIHNTLIAKGPDFETGIRIGTPTHNTDLAPTVCHLLDLAPAPTMVGRVLHEGMLEDDATPSEEVTRRILRTSRIFSDGAIYEQEVQLSGFRGRTYLDHGIGIHKMP
jgi:predicted AlkP superfamily pyrophosphatase or phosphodiesterase